MAHLAEKRVRGKRLLTCGFVVRSGLVDQVPAEIFERAVLNDRLVRSNARKRGQTQPKSECPAKRVCTHGTLASAAIAAKRVLLDSACDAHDPLPENLLDWRALRPTKRLKAKSSLDYLAAKGELAAGSG